MASERTPLLSSERSSSTAQSLEDDASAGRASPQQGTRKRSRWSQFANLLKTWKNHIAIITFAFVTNMFADIRIPATIRLVELALCREHYSTADPSVIEPDGWIPEELCKLGTIQSRLARVRGLMMFLKAVPPIIVAIPYGILADHRGRRLVTVLAVIGDCLADLWIVAVLSLYRVFSFNVVYVNVLFFFIGGGTPVISAVLLAMLADATPPNTRTRVFFVTSALILVPDLFSPSLSDILMKRYGPSIPYLLGLAGQFLALPIMAFATDTPRLKLVQRSEGNVISTPTPPNEPNPSKRNFILRQLVSAVDYAKEDIVPLIRQRNIVIGALTHLINDTMNPLEQIAIQYTSIRFSLPIRKAAYFISAKSGSVIIAGLLIFPGIHRWLEKQNPATTDVIFCRLSLVLLTCGYLWMGLSPHVISFFIGIAIEALGTGFGPSLRCYLTSLAPSDKIAVLYTAIALLQGIGFLVGPPLFSFALELGIKLGGVGTGLPFFLASVMFFICLIGLLLVRNAPSDSSTDEETDAPSIDDA